MVPLKGGFVTQSDFSELLTCTLPNGDPSPIQFSKRVEIISGKVSHLGKLQKSVGVHHWCTVYPDRLEGYATTNIIAANGDTLFTEFFVVFDNFEAPDELKHIILGGTGRFKNASGTFVTTFEGIEPGFTRLDILEGCITPPGRAK